MGLTMQNVADGAGLSVGFISQVERGLTAPSLASLVSIADVLGAQVSDFLVQPETRDALTRTEERAPYSVPGATHSYERLSTTFPGSVLHSVLIHEPPGHRSEPISHRGEEMFYMVDGALTVEIEGERLILRKGDSLHFDSRRVHSTWNHTDRTATILWCGTMDVFGARAAATPQPAKPGRPTGEDTDP